MSVTIEELRQEGKTKDFPAFRSGQTVRVHYLVKDGEKERTQIFEGLVISVSGKKIASQSIVVRKIAGGVAVEQGFAIHAPHIQQIELVKIGKVRRSRIFYMRERTGKAARLKERFYSDKEVSELIEANK